MKKKLLLLFLPVFLGSALVWNAGGLHSEEVGSAESMLPRIPRGDTAISVDFKEASLKDILKILSQQTGLSFVPSQDVEDKKLTIFFENVPVQNVIDSIVQANALSYEKGPDKNIFIVRPSGAEKIKTITKIYTLNFVQVSSMGSGSPGGSENSAMAGGGYNPEGASGQGGAGDGGIKGIISKVLSPVGNVVTDQRTNSLIITDIPERFTLIEEMIITLDTPTLQVFIEAEIIETSLQVAERLGLEYGGSSGQWAATYSGPSREYGFPYRTKIFKDQGSSPSYSLGSLQFGDISLLLKALTSNAKTKYLARPRILTLNNETATIEITSDSAIGSVTTSGESSGTSTTSPERQQTGVSLKVTPQINSAGFITMLIEPEVSRVQASTLSATVLDPIKRSAKAKVMVKDGHTIAIGGLIDTSTTDTAKKVPGLSAIPIVGALFKSDTVQDTQTEVLIFITPHIIKSESDVIKTAKVAGQEGLGPGAPAEPVKQPYRGAEAEGEEVSIEDIADEAVRKEVSEIDRTVAIDRAVENLKEGRF